MSRHIATYAGAGMVVAPGYNFGTDRQWEKLDDVFQKEVLRNLEYAWYVDHWTENCNQFGVRYLSQDPVIFWTNENLSQRDPNDLAGTTWEPKHVAAWFSTDTNSTERPLGTYRHIVRFKTNDGETHSLSMEAYEFTIDGFPGQVWERYVTQGVRGALEPFLSDFASLEAIEVHAI